MSSEEHRVPSDLFGRTFCSTVQSAIERLLVEGTRHGIDLKASDKLLDRNTELLSQDPSNSTLQAEQLRRKAARDESVKLIEALAVGIAQDIQQNFIQISVSSTSSTSPHPHPQRDGPSSSSSSSSALRQSERLGKTEAGITSSANHQQHQAESMKDSIVDLANDIKVLHKRIGKHSHEIDRIDCEHQVAIDALHHQIGAHTEAIQKIQDILPESPETGARQTATIIQKIANPDKSVGAAASNGVMINSTGQQSTTPSAAELLELRAEVARMEGRVTELRASVQTILTKEIPANLHQSVELMQQDVNATVQSSLTHAHLQLAQHIRDLILRFEPRILALERQAARLHHSLPDHLILHPPPLSAPSSPSNPSRLLQRRSSLLSPNHKLVSENESESCNQQ